MINDGDMAFWVRKSDTTVIDLHLRRRHTGAVDSVANCYFLFPGHPSGRVSRLTGQVSQIKSLDNFFVQLLFFKRCD